MPFPDVAGHKITFTVGEDGQATLWVNDVVMLTHADIRLNGPWIAGRHHILIGYCATVASQSVTEPFVIVLSEGNQPVIHGPIESKAGFRHTLPRHDEPAGGEITFTAVYHPCRPIEKWVWSFEAGFSQLPSFDFAEVATLGWEELEQLGSAHPLEYLMVQEVYRKLKSGLGADWPVFADLIVQSGQGWPIEDGYFAASPPNLHLKPRNVAGFFVHSATRAVSAFWWKDGGPVRMYPRDTDEWHPEMLAAFQWLSQ
jgi:hypothetical protein